MNTNKPKLTLREIKALMYIDKFLDGDKTPCVITPREQQPPSEDEIAEFYGVKSEAARRDYDSGTDHDL